LLEKLSYMNNSLSLYVPEELEIVDEARRG